MREQRVNSTLRVSPVCFIEKQAAQAKQGRRGKDWEGRDATAVDENSREPTSGGNELRILRSL